MQNCSRTSAAVDRANKREPNASQASTIGQSFEQRRGQRPNTLEGKKTANRQALTLDRLLARDRASGCGRRR